MLGLRSLTRLVVFAGAALLAACGQPQSAPGSGAQPVSSGATGSGGVIGAPRGATGAFQIVFLGDSLTAGLGLLTDQAFPALVQKKFAADGYSNVETVNAGITGDTSAGGLRRVEQQLTADTKILVVALGGNDALRGLTVSQTHDNLAGIINIALDRNVAVLLAGIQPPTNLGEDYRTAFSDTFMQLLREFHGRIALMPFLLEGVAGIPSLNQADGIHPNPDGAKVIAEAMYPRLQTIVDSIGGG